MITITLTDSIDVIQKNVNIAIAEQINNVLIKKQNILLPKAKALCSSWIEKQPEVDSLYSLDSNSLAGQFGISPGMVGAIILAIQTSIQNSITVKFTKYNDTLTSGGLEINFQPSNFINLLSLPFGHVIYENGDLHWLKWLLTAGDTVIVVNYQYNPVTGLGRSKLGNMIGGGSWRIPPQFSGTIDNNFITRALTSPEAYDDIKKLLQEILK